MCVLLVLFSNHGNWEVDIITVNIHSHIGSVVVAVVITIQATHDVNIHN